MMVSPLTSVIFLALSFQLFVANATQSLPGSSDFARLPVSWTVNAQDAETAREAWKTLSEYHQGKPKSNRKLHVVYVTFQDRPAFAGYHERYDRLLKNIQAYYADQMQANGFPPLTFQLDTDEHGKLIIHEAHVDQPMSDMTVNSSGPISREAAAKVLAQKGIDIEKEHVLVICQLPDGIGPYYGGGYSHNGTGWTCDQEGLDTKDFLDDSLLKEGRYAGNGMTRAMNATIYIGGTAHELGHSFGLPHTGNGWNYPDSGRSLMGDGNYTYATDLQGKDKGAYLAPTDALMLASVPLFNGVETELPKEASFGRTMGKFVPGGFQELEMTPVHSGLRLKGKVRLSRPAYGVVVHLDPPGGSDYDSNAVGAALDKDGNFDVTICRPGYRDGFIELRLAILNCDSTRSLITVPIWMTEQETEAPSLACNTYFSEVQNLWIQGKFEEATKALADVDVKYPQNQEVRKWIGIWRKALQSPGKNPTMLLKDIPAETKSVSLNEVAPIQAKVGWFIPLWDSMIPSDLGPVPFFRKGGRPEHFIFAHAPAVMEYDLDSGWKLFKAEFGLPCGMGHGSVRFSIWLDGKKLIETPVLHEGSSQELCVNVENGKKLEIRIDDGGDGNAGDWSVIADGKLFR